MITKPERIEYTLPHDVLSYIKKHFTDGIIIDIQAIKRDNGKINYYKVDVVDGEDTHYLRFDKKGRLVNDDVEVAIQEKAEPKAVAVEDEELEEI